MTEKAELYYKKLYPKKEPELKETDPEFAELFYNFSLDDVVNSDGLKDRTRMMAVLAALIGCQGVEEFAGGSSRERFDMGVAPEEVKEITYQAVAYLGIGRVRPFLTVVNWVFRQQEIPLPTKGADDGRKKGAKEKRRGKAGRNFRRRDERLCSVRPR